MPRHPCFGFSCATHAVVYQAIDNLDTACTLSHTTRWRPTGGRASGIRTAWATPTGKPCRGFPTTGGTWHHPTFGCFGARWLEGYSSQSDFTMRAHMCELFALPRASRSTIGSGSTCVSCGLHLPTAPCVGFAERVTGCPRLPPHIHRTGPAHAMPAGDLRHSGNEAFIKRKSWRKTRLRV